MKFIIFAAFLITIFLFLNNCSGNSISSPKDIVFPDSNVSFWYDVKPFLDVTCGFAGCHNYSAAGGINLTDYFEISKSPGLVIPGNPDGSYLIQVIEEKIPHFTYYEKSNINDNHKKGMRKWVKEGAKNN